MANDGGWLPLSGPGCSPGAVVSGPDGVSAFAGAKVRAVAETIGWRRLRNDVILSCRSSVAASNREVSESVYLLSSSEVYIVDLRVVAPINKQDRHRICNRCLLEKEFGCLHRTPVSYPTFGLVASL